MRSPGQLLVVAAAAFSASPLSDSAWRSSKHEWGDPDSWPAVYPTCGGNEQSPVDIHEGGVLVRRRPPLLFHGHWDSSVRASITNTGYTANVTAGNWTNPATLTGGPLHGRYVFAELHFHWGANSTVGSEHTLYDSRFSMEAHVVHFKEEYGSLARALAHPDGIAVVAFFLQVCLVITSRSIWMAPGLSKTAEYFHLKSKYMDGFSRITMESDTARRGLPNLRFLELSVTLPFVTVPGQKASLPLAAATSWFRPAASAGGYYTYQGSLTTPPCLEVVTWVLYPRPVVVSEAQVAMFRKLKTERRVPILWNYRPLQPLNDRPVTYAVSKH